MLEGILWHVFQWLLMLGLGYFGFMQLAHVTSDETESEQRTSTAPSTSKVENVRNIDSQSTHAPISDYTHNTSYANNNSHQHEPTVTTKTTIQNFSDCIPSLIKFSSTNNDWTNDLISWVFTNVHRIPKPLDSWIKGLNDAAKKINNPQTTEVIFEGYGDHSHVLNPPVLSNIRVENGPREQLTIKANIYIPEVIAKIVTSQRLNDQLWVANYCAHILKLSGEVEGRLASIANQLFFMGCFNGRPEFKVELEKRDDSQSNSQVNYSQIEDVVRRCVVLAVTNINLSEFNISDNSIATLELSPTNLSNMPVHEVVKRLHKSQMSTSFSDNLSHANKLRVKVIRAQKLGNGKDVHSPYVVVEIDEPAKRYKTSPGINVSPYWEESFDFTVTPSTEEILFELYEGVPLPDKHPKQSSILPNKETHQDDQQIFLGLAIVGLDELKRSNESLHCLRLQGRPYKNDQVSGTLTVEFQFYHDPTVTAVGEQVDEFVAVDKNLGTSIRETVTINKTPFTNQHDSFRQTDITPTNTTTLTIKTVTQQLKDKPLISSVHGSMENAMDPLTSKSLEYQLQQLNIENIKRRLSQNNGNITVESGNEYEQLHMVQNGGLYESYTSSKNGYSVNAPAYSADTMSRSIGNKNKNLDKGNRSESLDNLNSSSGLLDERSRGREKTATTKEKRDHSFFGNLRDRLSGRRSKSKLRAKSIDFEKNHDLEEAVSLPPSRDQSQTRYGSELSKSYVETKSVGDESNGSSPENVHRSDIVLELSQGNSIKKYFLIPPNIASEPAAQKLIKRGKKLHISNDHTFVAVKIKRGTVCNVCKHRIALSIVKQAYQCRDCRVVCHKSCHCKTISPCQQTNYHNLPMQVL
uniref:Phorbol-ester/DAG-type domain-containing protein n=1 Tax=Rhabditophanes sp. KR3021 TaxID=114890 RepID=A0AC35U645_9BILA